MRRTTRILRAPVSWTVVLQLLMVFKGCLLWKWMSDSFKTSVFECFYDFITILIKVLSVSFKVLYIINGLVGQTIESRSTSSMLIICCKHIFISNVNLKKKEKEKKRTWSCYTCLAVMRKLLPFCSFTNSFLFHETIVSVATNVKIWNTSLLSHNFGF